MNRNYKVVWNRSLGCFTAVAEYAKSRGKSSGSTVSSDSKSSAAVTQGARLLRLSAICAALVAAGLSMQANAANNYQGDNSSVNVAAGNAATLKVKGGATTNLSDGNIGVVGNDNSNTLTIKLSKVITGLTSVQTDTVLAGTVRAGINVLNGAGLTAGQTFVSSDGLNFVASGGTSTVAVKKDGINAGGFAINAVGAGVVNAGSQQAVNGGQLFNNAQSVVNNFGGSSVVNTNGTVSAPSYTLNGVTGAANNVGAALTNIDDRVMTNTSAINNLTNGTAGIARENSDGAISVGSTASATGDNSIAMGVGASATKSNSIAIGVGAQAIGKSSISIGTGNEVIGNNSGAIGDPTIINGNNSYAVGNNNTLNGNRAFILGNKNTINIGSNNSYTLGNDNTINGRRSFALGNGNEINSNNAFALGNGINIGSNLDGAVGIGNRTTVEASTVASFDPTGQLGAGVVGTDIGSNVVSFGSTDPLTPIQRRLTNVAAGGADTDAVNVSQLKAVDGKANAQGVSTAAALGGTAAYDENTGMISAPKYTLNNGANSFNNVGDALGNLDGRTTSNTNNIATIANNTATNTSNIATNATNISSNTNAIGDLNNGRTGMVQQNPTGTGTGTGNITVGAAKGGTEVSFAGTQGDRVLTNVADGMAPRDAVNFGQLNGMERRLSNSINELGYRIDDVEDDANAGISAAMAMSSLPQSNMAGRSMIGGGIATYNGESAVAVGISRVSDNGRWAMKINGTADTQGNAGGAIGAGFHF